MTSVMNPVALNVTTLIKSKLPEKNHKKRLPRKPRTGPNKKDEKKIERSIINYLRKQGCICGKVNPEIGGWNNGVADILCFKRNRGMWWIEVKTPIGKQSSIQVEFENLVKSVGGQYVLARQLSDVYCIVEPYHIKYGVPSPSSKMDSDSVDLRRFENI